MPSSSVIAHYDQSADLLDRILAALASAGVDPARLTLADLAPIDEFHIGGEDATRDLAGKLTFANGARVLDVGSGLGGPARRFAAEYGVHVTGIDLTPGYVAVATALSARVGLADRVAFDVGSAEALPYAADTFDGAFTIHVAMNVADRPRFYAEVARVLRQGALFGMYDVMRGPNPAPIAYPTPWAADETTSWIFSLADTERFLVAAGFDIVAIEDRSTAAKRFFADAAAAAKARGGRPPVGLHIVTGPNHTEKARNVAAAVADGRLAPTMIVARKA